MTECLFSRRAWRIALSVAIALYSTAARAAAQHEGHQAMTQMSMDTLATAPTTPTRPRNDSAIVADSLLSVCQPQISHSIDAYST